MKFYTFAIVWLHLAGEDPEHRMYDEVNASSVPRAITRLRAGLREAGYDSKDVLIIEAANKDIA